MSQDAVEERIRRGLSLINACDNNGVTCRLLGGVAVVT